MKKWKIAIAVLVVIIVGGVLWFRANTGLKAKPRRAWKDAAIADITRLAADSKWLESELGARKAAVAKEPEDDGWISDHFALMKNGDWIVYSNICQKKDFRIHDIFIGRGSDGKWYYSTFHFCISMIIARMEPQPESLTQFVDWYHLEEFDGRSDECLNSTWPLKEGEIDPKASKRGRWK